MKKRTPQGIGLILVLILTGLLVNKFLFDTSSEVTVGGILNIKAHELNKSLPMDLDENTRVVKAQYIPPNSLRMNYVLHDVDWDNFDLKYFQDSTRHELLKTIINDPGLKLLRDSSVYFEFHYNDSTSRLVHKFQFGPEDYR